jgi:trk system potassium uptake protein TrkH
MEHAKPEPRDGITMNYRAVTGVTGTLILVTGLAMLLPIGCALWYGGEGDLLSLLVSAGSAVVVGLVLRRFGGGNLTLTTRDAFFASTLGWIIVSAVSAVPFIVHGSIPSFTDAFFEMMSGC